MENPTVVDLSNVPSSLEGQWVVFSQTDHRPLGSGPTPLAALAEAGLAQDAEGILLAKIPSGRFPVVA